MNRRELFYGLAALPITAAAPSSKGEAKTGTYGATIRAQTALGMEVVPLAIRGGKISDITDERVAWMNVPRGLWRKSLGQIHREQVGVRLSKRASGNEFAKELFDDYVRVCLPYGCTFDGEVLLGPIVSGESKG